MTATARCIAPIRVSPHHRCRDGRRRRPCRQASQTALTPLEYCFPPDPLPFSVIAARHADPCCSRSVASPRSWREPSTSIAEAGCFRSRPPIIRSCSTWPSRSSRCGGPNRPCASRSTGLLEARLQSVGCLVLGGLVEGVWPPQSRGDPWLSRPMRQELGLDLPERRIGLSAHDFAQALGAPRGGARPRGQARRRADRGLALRAAARRGRRSGSPWAAALARGANYAAAARANSTRPGQPEAAPVRPAPKPPLEARPRPAQRHRDRALAARPLHDLRQACLEAPSRSTISICRRARPDRGTLIHDFIGDFAKGLPADDARRPGGGDAGDRRAAFQAAGGLSRRRGRSGGRASCASRDWLARFEIARRARARSRLDAEIGGSIAIPFGSRGVQAHRARRPHRAA